MRKAFLLIVLIAVTVILSGCIEPPITCGNGICEAGENHGNCPIESGGDCPPTDLCGNGVCDVAEGENSINCPEDCPPTETHFECQTQSCVEVPGTGTNQCTTDVECQGPPTDTHFECQNQACVEISGAEADTCATDTDCQIPPTETHFECQAQACVEVDGAGQDTCTTDTDCQTLASCGNEVCDRSEGENSTNCPEDCQPILPETHFECQSQACIEVDGRGYDQCATNVTCLNPVEIEDNFEQIFQGSSNGEKIKLFFINYGYPENGYDAFDFDTDYTVFADDYFEGWKYKGILKTEPYQTYKENFEIYQLNRLLNQTEVNCDISDPANPCDLQSILSFARSYNGLNLGYCDFSDSQGVLTNCNIMVIFIKDRTKLSSYPGSAGHAGGDYIYVLIEDDSPGEGIKKVFLTVHHEAGHLFGKILDEYFSGYAQGQDYTSLDVFSQRLEGANCDIRPGCPSWCAGNAQAINRDDPCMNIETEEECNTVGMVWGTNICMWMTNQEIVNFFGSNCIPEGARGNAFYYNSGNQCGEGLGCYYGCNGSGWRSTLTSLYVGWIDGVPQEWNNYSKDGLEPYNTIQKNMIIEKIENALNSQ